jgi:SAM-dependent methyltransferase
MKPDADPGPNLDELMQRIRADVNRRRRDADAKGSESVYADRPAINGPTHSSSDSTRVDNAGPSSATVSYAELCALQDVEFVRNAYRVLLRREPEPDGLNLWVNMLRDGAAKARILGAIRYSPEGRRAGVRIPGLGRSYAIQRVFGIPVVGGVLETLAAPLIARQALREQRRIAAKLAGVSAELQVEAQARSQDRAELERVLAQRSIELDEAMRRELKHEFESRLMTMSGIVRAQADKIAILRGERSPGAQRDMDEFHAAFEDRFRGSRAEIRDRLAIYLPYVRSASAGSATAPVLDLGSGRGEWLEILREQGYVARGVERNRALNDLSRAKGLNVLDGDMFRYLAELPDNSLGAITCFHVVEHLSFDLVLRLFDEIVRVLRHGGVAIVETPNPENLVVGACSFYLDPTHWRPLPAQLLEFIAGVRGLVRTEVLPLHPLSPATSMQVESELDREVSRLLYGPRDYSLIGYKAEC